MAVFKSLLATVALVSLFALSQCNGAFARSHSLRNDEVRARQFEAAKRYTVDNLLKAQQTSSSQPSDDASATGIKNITFGNPLANREFKSVI